MSNEEAENTVHEKYLRTYVSLIILNKISSSWLIW